METHTLYGITPGRDDSPASTPANKSSYSDSATPEGCKAELTQLAWLHTEAVHRPEDGHPSQY